MKTTQKLALALILCIASIPASAAVWTSTPTKFTPTPLAEGKPLRFLVNLDNANVFSGGGFQGMNGYLASGGQVGLMNLQLNLALMYNVWDGFDVGLGLHGGLQSPYSMFFGDGPSSPTQRYSYMLGADFMARYLARFSDIFYGGIQAQVGYNYTDGSAGVPDLDFSHLGQTSRTAFNSFIPIVMGIVLGVDFKDAAAIYLFPAIEMGQTGNYTSVTAPVTPDTGVWKSAVGLQLGVGTAIHSGFGDIIVQATPRLANFSNQYSWGFDLTTGMQWDF